MKITMEELPLLQVHILSELRDYVASRKNDVVHGAATPELAALQVETYGYGLATALATVEDLLDAPRSNLISLVDRLVLEINPNVVESRRKHYASRPASISPID